VPSSSAAGVRVLPGSTDDGARLQNDQDDTHTHGGKHGEEDPEHHCDTNLKDTTTFAEAGGDMDHMPIKKDVPMAKFKSSVSRFIASDLLDTRVYRDEVSSTNGIYNSNKVLPLDDALDDESMKTRANGESGDGTGKKTLLRRKDRKSCLRAQSTRIPRSARIARDLQKRQRVRFYLPKKGHELGRFLALFEPDSAFVVAWSTFLVLPMAYELWAGAFRLALGTPQQGWLYSIDLASDGFFVADGMIQLNTAIKQNQDGIGGLGRSSDILLIRSRRSIAIRYFTRCFPSLILTSVVYHTGRWMSIEEDAEKQDPNLWVWWIGSLPRLVFRVRYLLHFFKAMDMNLNVAVSSMQAVKFVLMVFMSAHWIGSLSFFAARIQPAGTPTWLDSLAPIFPLFERETAFSTAKSLGHYILCLYKGVDGLVSIGYFPIVPNNTIEMVLAVSVQYLAILVTAYILGSLFHYLLVSQKDALKEAHTRKMQDLENFMEERHVSLATRRRLEHYFEFQVSFFCWGKPEVRNILYL
jgi:hypothetical protein